MYSGSTTREDETYQTEGESSTLLSVVMFSLRVSDCSSCIFLIPWTTQSLPSTILISSFKTGTCTFNQSTLILRNSAISLQYFIPENLCIIFQAIIVEIIITMIPRLTNRIRFLFRTHEQTTFLDFLPKMKFTSDEQLITNIRVIYDKREMLEECQAFSDVTNRIENYLLKNPKCTVAHLQCYNILREMRMVSSPFRHNLHHKYYRFLLTPTKTVKNEHLEKYLWFLFEEGRFQREMFREAAESHTLTLFQIYQYMNNLKDLPTWEPYIRIVNMLACLGHQIQPHQGLGAKEILARIQYKYYPYIARLFTPQQMLEFQSKNRYDNPYLTYLCDEYVLKNASRYDSYLQRVELVELEQQYERILDVMDWSEFPLFLDLMLANYQSNGGNDELESRVSQIFFRLCQHDDINLETIASIFASFLEHPNFMLSRRFPIITRCTDSIFKRGLQDFSYLSGDAFVSLLDSSKKLEMDKDSRQYLQKFLCKKVANKSIWSQGQVDRLREFAQSNEVSGGLQLLSYLNQLQLES